MSMMLMLSSTGLGSWAHMNLHKSKGACAQEEQQLPPWAPCRLPLHHSGNQNTPEALSAYKPGVDG